MTRNLILLFAATFVLTTAFDIWTTWVGVNQLGYTELNPLTDTSSIEAMAIPEVFTLFIGIAMVAAGVRFAKRLRPLPDERFGPFYRRFLTDEKFFHLLVLIPMLVAVVRIVPVLSNASFIFYGWGLFEIDAWWTNKIVMIIFFMILTRPTAYFIYVVCRASNT